MLISRYTSIQRFPTDRTTAIGKMIGDYLVCKDDLEDHVIHLLFSANRWEALWVVLSLSILVDCVVCVYSNSGRVVYCYG